MQVMTYLNITATDAKMIVAFLYATVIVPFMGFRFILLYLHKYHCMDDIKDEGDNDRSHQESISSGNEANNKKSILTDISKLK